MAMLGDVDKYGFLPAEKEVAASGAKHNSQTQPYIVRHEDQHQQEAQRNLDDVQQCLVDVHRRRYRWSASKIQKQIGFVIKIDYIDMKCQNQNIESDA